MKRLFLFISGFCFFLMLFQCASGPETAQPTPEPTPEPTVESTAEPTQEPANLGTSKGDTFDTGALKAVIRTVGNGFSPNGDGFKDVIEFQIVTEQPEKIASWKITMRQTTSEKMPREISGKKAPPQTVAWDGLSDEKQILGGTYTALLALEYEGSSKPVKAESSVFILDTQLPEVRLNIKPLPFNPDGDGIDDTLTISLSVVDASPIEKWEIDIYDEAGNLFHSFSGNGAPGDPIVWDGINSKGTLVEIAEDYKTVASVTDNLRNTGKAELPTPVSFLVTRDADNRLRLKIAFITFKAYDSDYKDTEGQSLKINLNSFRLLAKFMKKYTQYKILIEGHAMMPNDKLGNQKIFDQYNKDVLVPLSKKRAEMIKKELITLGMEPERILTDGLGASRPLYPHTDNKNREKNRRVEFYLVEK